MVDLYLSLNADDKDGNMHVYLLEAAFHYFNERFRTKLKVNYNYKAEECVDETVEVVSILRAIAEKKKLLAQKATYAVFTNEPALMLLTRRRKGNSSQLKCPKEHGMICYCGPQLKFRKRFFGSNIYAIFAIEEKVECFICGMTVDAAIMLTHLGKHCNPIHP